MSDLTLDVGLAAKLKVAFARNGWTEQLIDAACEGDKLGQFKQVLLGHAFITAIDCGADPFWPKGCSSKTCVCIDCCVGPVETCYYRYNVSWTCPQCNETSSLCNPSVIEKAVQGKLLTWTCTNSCGGGNDEYDYPIPCGYKGPGILKITGPSDKKV